MGTRRNGRLVLAVSPSRGEGSRAVRSTQRTARSTWILRPACRRSVLHARVSCPGHAAVKRLGSRLAGGVFQSGRCKPRQDTRFRLFEPPSVTLLHPVVVPT